MEENKFMITPSELDSKVLYEFLINNVSHKKVMELYLLLKNDIQQPGIRVLNEHYRKDNNWNELKEWLDKRSELTNMGIVLDKIKELETGRRDKEMHMTVNIDRYIEDMEQWKKTREENEKLQQELQRKDKIIIDFEKWLKSIKGIEINIVKVLDKINELEERK